MISEDYVSFKIAKLLKEKGFDAECRAFYVKSKECGIELFHAKEPYNYNNNVHPCTSAPTLQMTMKWLWEKHKKHVEPAMTIERLGFTFLNKWHCFVMSVDNKNQTDLKCVGEDFSSYEEACEFGIKYCLKMIYV